MESVPVHESAVVDAKFRRANDLLRELDAKVAGFNSLGAVTAVATQIDPYSYEYRLKIKQQPPLEEWSLLLGDALHNLRSSLDTLAWELANLDRPPARPKAVYFPTALNEADWRSRWAPVLESVPPVFLERLKLAQGFSRTNVNANDALRHLHALDIEDKHRGLLRADAGPGEFTYQTEIKIGDGVTPQSGDLTPIKYSDPSAFVEGNGMFGYRGTTPISVVAPISIPVPVLPVLFVEGSKYRALQLAAQLSAMVAFTLDRVCLGEDAAIANAIRGGIFEVVEADGKITLTAT